MKPIAVFVSHGIKVYKLMHHPYYHYRIMKLNRDGVGWATFHTAREAEEYLREVLV